MQHKNRRIRVQDRLPFLKVTRMSLAKCRGLLTSCDTHEFSLRISVRKLWEHFNKVSHFVEISTWLREENRTNIHWVCPSLIFLRVDYQTALLFFDKFGPFSFNTVHISPGFLPMCQLSLVVSTSTSMTYLQMTFSARRNEGSWTICTGVEGWMELIRFRPR